MFVRTYQTVNLRSVNFLYINYISKYSYGVIPIYVKFQTRQNKHELFMNAYIRGESNKERYHDSVLNL